MADGSSSTSVLTARQYFLLPHTFSKSAELVGTPGPGFDCIVCPPTRMAAIPVGAQTSTEPEPFRSSRAEMICCVVKLLPVPGPPVMKRLLILWQHYFK